MYIFKLYFAMLFLQQSFGEKKLSKSQEGYEAAQHIFSVYLDLFQQCVYTSMPSHRFIADNLHSYINEFSKTTVGYAHVFTGNRKFFANMINTADFKNSLEKDVIVLQNNIVEKMKFCDNSVMDQEYLKLSYDREVDQTKQ